MKIRYFFTIFGLFITQFILSNYSASACTYKPTMTGDSLICSGNTGSYSTTNTASHYYRWIARGGSIVSGQGSASLLVMWPNSLNGQVVLIDSTTGCYDSVKLTVKVGLSQATLQSNPFTTVGSASRSGKTYSVTPGTTTNELGAAWCINSVSLNKNWDFTFNMTQCKGNTSGIADGMMFVIQNNGTKALSAGVGGSDLGYYESSTGQFAQSIGMEFDIWQSGAYWQDSSASHMSLVKNADPTPLRPQLYITSPNPLGTNCTPRKFRIVWNRSINLMDFYFDGKKKFSWNNDVVKNIFKNNPNVWFGITGADGSYNSTQSISIDTMIYGQPIIIASRDTACTGDSITLTSSTGINYLWSTGDKTKSIKVGKSGTYTVTITDSTKCSNISLPYNITFIPKDSASFTVGKSSCQGGYISLTNNSTPTTGLKYLWKFGNGDSSLAQTPGYKYNTPGIYTINLSVTNGGCTSKASNSTTIYPAPYGSNFVAGTPFTGQFNSGDQTNPDNVCLNDTVTYQILPPKAFSNSDYGTKWVINSLTFTTPYGLGTKDTATKLPSTNKNGTFSFFPKKYGDSTFLLVIDLKSLPGNCDSVIRRNIHVRYKPVAKFGTINACQGSAITFKDSSTETAAAVTTWAWDFGDTKTSTAQNPTHIYATSGTNTVTLKVTTDAGCSNTTTKTVTTYPNPVSKFIETLGCNGYSTAFADTSTIAAPGVNKFWNWNFGDGKLSNIKKPTHIYIKSGPYTVKLVVISANGCKDSTTTKIRILPTPIANFSYLNACVGTAIYMSNTSIDSTNKSSYKWDFGDKSAISTASTPPHTYTANGTYQIKLTVTSGAGCVDTIVKSITPIPKPNPDIFAANGCIGQSVTFSDSSHSDKSSLYTWDFGDKTTTSVVAISTKHSYKTAGNYKVVLTIENGGGCTDTQSRVINIMDFPKSSFTATTVCQGNVTNFTNASTGLGTLLYAWDFGDNTKLSTLQNPTHTYAIAGTFIAKLLVTNKNGCFDSSSVNTIINPLPIINPWTYKKHGYEVTFIPADSTIGNFDWHFGTTTNDSSSKKSPLFIYPSIDQTYTVSLTVKNTNGCVATRTDTVSVSKSGISEPGNSFENVTIYPNPFEGSTSISYTLGTNSKVSIGIYDAQGKRVAQLKDGNYPAGKYNETFEAKKYQVEEGVYFLKMYLNDKYFTTKIVNLK